MRINEAKISDIMNVDIIAAHREDDIIDAIEYMKEYALSSLPVVDDENHVIGFLSDIDVMKSLSHALYQGNQQAISLGEIMSRDLQLIKGDDNIFDVIEKFSSHHMKSAPVVDDENHLMGMISRGELLEALKVASAQDRGFKSSAKGPRKLEVSQNKRVRMILSK
ncbi:CBS domain-containing protein [Bacteriovorax sp. DB6_IX]|uniref:CBS domain-containing protein n=1 Tax=Bacteriovorax sp. DB6_IX TaxID=1353530 RepID=UPI000389E1BA|nr:CBS domain-containing protein [Bacteriovorax sp. DB6_IX]EQC50655.1 CBS domain protein [Bacteriovorax sp. DB6_IX]